MNKGIQMSKLPHTLLRKGRGIPVTRRQPRRPTLPQLKSIRIRQTFFFKLAKRNTQPGDREVWSETKKGKGGGVGAWEARPEITHAVVFLSFLFFWLAKHARQGRAIRGREMVAALGLDEKKTRIEHKVTSNNRTRKHTNSPMQIIERKCKAQKGAGTRI